MHSGSLLWFLVSPRLSTAYWGLHGTKPNSRYYLLHRKYILIGYEQSLTSAPDAVVGSDLDSNFTSRLPCLFRGVFLIRAGTTAVHIITGTFMNNLMRRCGNFVIRVMLHALS